MKYPVIYESNVTNIFIILFSLFISAFTLLFGIANLINPEVSDEFLFKNTLVCIALFIIGVFFLLVAISSFWGILNNYQKNKL
jgi:hypothetical protein